MTPTTAAGSATAYLSADEVYDLLMKDIEPELMSGTVDTLQEKYRGESPADAKARAKRYKAAFAEYDRRLDAYVAKINEQTLRNSRAAAQSLEQSDRLLDAFELAKLETDINH